MDSEEEEEEEEQHNADSVGEPGNEGMSLLPEAWSIALRSSSGDKSSPMPKSQHRKNPFASSLQIPPIAQRTWWKGKLLPILAANTMEEEVEHTGLPKCHLSLYSSIVQDLDSYRTPKEQNK
ncbi:hypothetical protein BTVI_20275 [Pitangus sulphuratus]|nr:hypothetical protein BTVI_20275 [Pitangus sulphuratus]